MTTPPDNDCAPLIIAPLDEEEVPVEVAWGCANEDYHDAPYFSVKIHYCMCGNDSRRKLNEETARVAANIGRLRANPALRSDPDFAREHYQGAEVAHDAVKACTRSRVKAVEEFKRLVEADADLSTEIHQAVTDILVRRQLLRPRTAPVVPLDI